MGNCINQDQIKAQRSQKPNTKTQTSQIKPSEVNFSKITSTSEVKVYSRKD
jgi:hypothetical protein